MGEDVVIWEQAFRAASEPSAGTGKGEINPLEPGLWRRLNWRAEVERKGIEQVINQAAEIAEVVPGFFPTLDALPREILLHSNAQQLRLNVLNTGAWVELLCGSDDQAALPPELLQEFIQNLERQNLDVAMEARERVLKHSPYREWLAVNEPDRLTEEAERRQHQEFLNALANVPVTYYPVGLIAFTQEETYLDGALSEEDRILAGQWAQSERDKEGYGLAKMLSARAAEKIAKRFYENLGHANVRDVSITQLSRREEAWKTHDLEVDGRPVDVKNSRSPKTRARYSEHAISRFKQNRNGRRVTITGVRSPYLRIEPLTEQEALPMSFDMVQVLGETTRPEIEALRAQFTSEMLHDLGVDRGRGEEEYLPPWVFNYPDEFYAEEPSRSYRESVAALGRQTPPSWSAVRRFKGERALPLLIQAGTPLPESWRAALQPWQAELVDRIAGSEARVSLPHLFLTLLTDFLTAVRDRRAGDTFQPNMYRPLLYQVTAGNGSWTHAPLGIFDPLKSINDLIGTLHALWTNRNRSRLLEFTRLKFRAAGMLRGSRADRPHHEVSLLAWCGGFRCDVSDLVNGRDQECSCGFLICRECGLCSSNCPEWAQRQAGGEEDLAF